MAKKTKSGDNYSELPILTVPPEAIEQLPILTEKLIEEISPQLPLTAASGKKTAASGYSEQQYQQLGLLLAPKLEQALQQKFAARLEALWPEIWQEVEAELPRLLRELVEETARRTRK